MKKVFALLLALSMIFALAACGQSAPAATEAPATEAPATEAPAAEEPVAEAPAVEEAPAAVMSHADFIAAELDSPVTVEGCVQAVQSWWDNKATIYLADADGGYLLYDAACSEDDYAKLVPGQKLRAQGYKSEWSGEVEIVDASFELLEGDPYIAAPVDITALLGTDELASLMNQRISVSDAVVADKGDGAAFFFNWDNSGEDGNCDLYFDLEVNGGVYTFVVRRYLTAPGSEVYEAVKNLQVGQTVDIEGMLYWYEGPQPHITNIVVK